MANIGIIGAGSWGTALGILLVNNGHKTTLWSHRQEQAEELDRTGSIGRNCLGSVFLKRWRLLMIWKRPWLEKIF